MNWTKLSAISEILSSVAILVTLIYLAIQTQQNADAIQASTRQAILEADQQLLLSTMEDQELQVIRYKPELTDDEKIQLGVWLIAFIRMRENNWSQYQNGVLDEATWYSYRSSIVAGLSSAKARTWWQKYAVNRGAFDSEFMSMVDELLANTPVQKRSPLIEAFD